MAREVPRYAGQLSIGSMPKISYVGLQAQAEATGRVSAQLGVLAEDTMKKSAELQDLRTETTYKENLSRIYNENRDNPDGFNKSYDGFYKEFRSKLPNSEFTEKLDIQHTLFSQSYRDRVMEQYSQNVDEDHKTEQLKTLTANQALMAEAAKGLVGGTTPETRAAAAEQIKMLSEQNAQILASKDYKGGNVYSPEYQVKHLTDTGKIMFEAIPAEKRLEVLGDTAGGFESSVATVLKHEGGYNDSDGNTGDPVNFGINQGAHPGVDVKNMTQAQAIAIYKKDYWDHYKIGELPANVQGIVMDGVVNHWTNKEGTGFKDKLVEAARNGATPTELLDMRQHEYDRLAATGRYSKGVVASWNNRLDDYRHLEVTDYEKYITPDTRDALVKAARAEIETKMTMRRDDPVKAAMLDGARTVTDVVQPQLARGVPQQYTRVLDNQTAETMAQRINQSQNTDDIVRVVGELQQTYGEFTPNAIADLKEKGKMKPEMEGALSLAAANNPAYKEHIDLLTQAGAAGETAINEVFAVNQYSVQDLNAKLSAETEDWQRAILNEGKSPKEMQEKLQVVASLAKAKMNKALDGRYGDAVEFAIKPEQDMYAIRDYRGDTYRIPTKFTADDVEDGLEIAMKDKLPKLVVGSTDENYVYSDTVSPFLSPLEDGIMFRTPMGEVVADKAGKPIEFKFTELVGTKKVRPINTYKPTPKGGM